MIIAGSTPILVNGRRTRVLSSRFNRALKRSAGEPVILDVTGGRIVPSKGLAWSAVAALVRSGKKVQAKIDMKHPLAGWLAV